MPGKSEELHLFDWLHLLGHFPVAGHMSVITQLHFFNLTEKVAKEKHVHALNNTNI